MMKNITTIQKEAPVTFGSTKIDHMVRLYNLRITYSQEEIVMVAPDIKACFRFPRMQPGLAGSFSFVIGSLFFLDTAMVFGLVVSASSWEPFWRAIMATTQIYFGKKG